MYHHHRSDFAERRREMTQSSTGNTGTRDVIYDLVSVLYHALQGAETYDQYIKDAQQRGAPDLVQFFHDTKEEERRRAERAKQLLARHFEQELKV
jgi:hypothetical protein